MKHVLFITDTLRPRREVFEHTVHMCAEMTSRLQVLQVINPKRCRQLLSSTQTRLERMQNMMEAHMCAATYAQAGAFDLARECLRHGQEGLAELQPLAERTGIGMHWTQRVGAPVHEISAFLDERPNIVMAVFDAVDIHSQRGAKNSLRKLRKTISYQMGIPLTIPI